MSRYKVALTLLLTLSLEAYAEVRCYDMDRLLNYVCYRICTKHDYDLGHYDKEYGDCICEDKPYKWSPSEASVIILPPLETNLSSQPYYDAF